MLIAFISRHIHPQLPLRDSIPWTFRIKMTRLRLGTMISMRTPILVMGSVPLMDTLQQETCCVMTWPCFESVDRESESQRDEHGPSSRSCDPGVDAVGLIHGRWLIELTFLLDPATANSRSGSHNTVTDPRSAVSPIAYPCEVFGCGSNLTNDLSA
ncbi:uncharacterized protein K489DRAFT_190688 [Dissoconium aciculare CBS 342.82]|uniref:Uncharacterized protein n=1 Tax=Dissoconium aciculare CBS 342.82 TaxID=1314786 RepID=A0A6J3M5U1_9PEZI|nr:uncharacterized protein K489DRAFT_190688 [Dissoconium aciculare CBS 342.82]KAF1823248.1 hypothetical protein K489DRAFT_190688 [Dissoconium aciculare CBS 342.82]